MLKILSIMSNPAIGGTETFVLSMTPYLEKIGCAVDIMNTWRGSLMKKAALEAKLSYRELYGNSRFISPRSLAQLANAIRRGKYDIVLVFGLRASVLLRLLKPFFKNVPLITGLREVGNLRNWHHTWLDRLTQGKCDLFVSNSDAVGRVFTTRERLSSDKMVVIKNGISSQQFDRSRYRDVNKQSFGLPADKVIITTVANFRYEKGHDFYVEVIRAFLEEFENAHFVWIGEGSLKSKLKNMVRSIGAFDKITFLGLVEDVRPVLSCSDIFVLPSREEGMSRALMEAMAMSLPCVATDVGGANEVIVNGVSGLIVEFGNVEDFGGQIVKLTEDGDLRRKMGAAARLRIIENFDMEKIAKKYVRLFELVAAGHRDGEEIQRRLDE